MGNKEKDVGKLVLVGRKATLVSIALCIIVLGFALSLNAAKAGTATTITGVETYDSLGNIKTSSYGDNDPFTVGDYIYISWAQIIGTATVDVSATDPSLNTVSIYKVSSALDTPVPGVTPESTAWLNQGNPAKLCLVIYAATPGIYHIKVDGTGGATMTLDVTVVSPPSPVPENPLGSLIATLAGFTAFGVVAVAKFRSPRKLNPF